MLTKEKFFKTSAIAMLETFLMVLINGKTRKYPKFFLRGTVLYVVAFNVDLSWKDVTRRYASSYFSTTRKQRVDEKWWKKLMAGRQEKSSARSRAEDEVRFSFK